MRHAVGAADQAMHRAENELGGVLQAVLVGAAQQQAEFVAAQPAGHVRLGGHRAQDVGHALQHAVAGLVAVHIVDLLELVAVDQQQALRRAAFLRTAVLQVERQAAPVVQAGQLVGAHQLAGVGELVGSDVEVVQRGFEIVVAALTTRMIVRRRK